MEELDAKQRESISKMSTQRLVAKLAQLGLADDVLENMQRADLLNEYAQAIATGKGIPATAATAARGAGIELEKSRLQLERDRLDLERAKLQMQQQQSEREAQLRQDELRRQAEQEAKDEQRRQDELRLKEEQYAKR